jgi:soluble lytic murein transglycosylase
VLNVNLCNPSRQLSVHVSCENQRELPIRELALKPFPFFSERPWIVLLVLIFLLLAAASCSKDASAPQATPKPTATLEPTPTLVQGLPTSTISALVSATTSHAGESTPIATATFLPTATASPLPSATPKPAESLKLGQSSLANEDFASAVERFSASLNSNQLDIKQQQLALTGLGLAHLSSGQHEQAVDVFSQYLAQSADTDKNTAVPGSSGDWGEISAGDAHFFLAKSYEALSDCEAAVKAYRTYLDENPDMNAYIQPRIADCLLQLGDRPGAVTALEEAVNADALPSVVGPLRERLAQMYLEDGDLDRAAKLYESILASEQNDEALARSHYLLGSTLLLAGDAEAGYGHYLTAVTEYPRAYDSYLALTELIQAGILVDDFQRGLIDYHAGAYEPAIAALTRHIEEEPEYDREAHLYLAWTYEEIGNADAALEQVDAYIQTNTPVEDSSADEGTPAGTSGDSSAAARGWIERAKMQARAGNVDGAIDSYLTYVELFPDGEQGPFAAWWAAALSERLGDLARAIERYLALAEVFPDHDDASEGLFRAGYLNWQQNSIDEAISIWREAAEEYPEREFGAASLLWLLKTSTEDTDEEFRSMAAGLDGQGYYTLRARQVVSETAPFERPDEISLHFDATDRLFAEAWLREQLQIEDIASPGTLSAELADDGRLLRGQKLWRLGLREEAKRELESLRFDYRNDPLASYQLAIFFSELGLYRSSILAAESVMRELGVNVFEVPVFLGRLAYPTYYSDLVIAEAEKYDSDPLLQFALIRQESLFESFATSSAVAQGLSQVIPDTGAYIAQRLSWPDFENEDLYRPYVGITFGAYYLNQQLDAFDDNVAVALSAYNGGPGNASRWYAEAPDDLDEFLETVDFAETRLYIKRIYAGHAIYRFLYGS